MRQRHTCNVTLKSQLARSPNPSDERSVSPTPPRLLLTGSHLLSSPNRARERERRNDNSPPICALTCLPVCIIEVLVQCAALEVHATFPHVIGFPTTASALSEPAVFAAPILIFFDVPAQLFRAVREARKRDVRLCDISVRLLRHGLKPCLGTLDGKTGIALLV